MIETRDRQYPETNGGLTTSPVIEQLHVASINVPFLRSTRMSNAIGSASTRAAAFDARPRGSPSRASIELRSGYAIEQTIVVAGLEQTSRCRDTRNTSGELVSQKRTCSAPSRWRSAERQASTSPTPARVRRAAFPPRG